MCWVQRMSSEATVGASFCFQAEDGIRDLTVTGVQTCALPIWLTTYWAYRTYRAWARCASASHPTSNFNRPQPSVCRDLSSLAACFRSPNESLDRKSVV